MKICTVKLNCKIGPLNIYFTVFLHDLPWNFFYPRWFDTICASSGSRHIQIIHFIMLKIVHYALH